MKFAAALILAVIVGGCESGRDPVMPDSEGAAGYPVQQSEVLARAIAAAMASSDFRTIVRDAMRASLLTEHKLSFRDFVSTPSGNRLLSEAARASGRSVEEIRDLVAALPETDFYVPAREHRLAWKGSDDVMVAMMVTSTAPSRAYTPHGKAVSLDFEKSPRAYPALFLLQYAEAKDRRITPQANVPGFAIQDPGDGEIGGLMPVFGLDGKVEWKQLADLVEAGQVSFDRQQVTPQQTCQPGQCGGGGGGGGGGTPKYTYLTRFQTVNVFDGTDWETNEFEWRAVGPDGHALYPSRWPRIEGIGPNQILITNLAVLDRQPTIAYQPIRIPIYETDVVNSDYFLDANANNIVLLRDGFSGTPRQFSLWRNNYELDYPTSNTAYATFLYTY